MRVGIEASAAMSNGRTGVGTYTANMIAGLERIARSTGDIELLHFSNRRLETGLGDASVLDLPPIYPHDQFRSRLIWMQLLLPRSLASTRPDLCHFPNYLGPVLRRLDMPFLVTMYDMSVYRYPQYQPAKTVAVHRAIMPALARRAAFIVTISESARQDILRCLPVPEERVRVVYGGIGGQFQPSADPGASDAEVLRRYGLSFPYGLTVGTLEPRKNHLRLVRAFSRMVQQERVPHHLVIVGTRGWKDGAIYAESRESPVACRYHFLGYVPVADLPALYRSADAFAFPSLYEGFGLPVLEALACGVPCLISADPALREVAGEGAAVVVDATSVEDIADGLHRILCDGTLRTGLRARGLARARGFRWDRCAAETLQLYREVASHGHGTSTRIAVAR